MKLLFSGYNGFGQWPIEKHMTCDFKVSDLETYLDFQDKIEHIDWRVEWAYNVFILNSRVIVKGFCENCEGKLQVLLHPDGGIFTNASCNDKHLLLYNYKEKNVWKFYLDPEVEEKWKMLPNFLNSERKLEHETSGDTIIDVDSETILKIDCGIMINLCLTSEGRLFNIPSEISRRNIVGKVVDICCGYEHGVLLTDQGNVYTLGGGSRCQLGHGSIDSSDEPQLVEALAGIEIVKIASGGWHTCAISSIGDLYTWGWNDRGQLGMHSDPETNKLEAVAENSGTNHTLENKSDNVFDDCFDTCSEDIDFANEKHIEDDKINNDFDDDSDECSEDFPNLDANVVSNAFEIGKRSQSDVFDDNLRIEQRKRMKSSKNDDRVCSSYAIPNLIDIYDSRNGKILELNVVDVSCGSKHTVIKLDDGSIWGTGCNKYGQLGFNIEVIERVHSFTMLNVKAKNAVLKCGTWATSLLIDE